MTDEQKVAFVNAQTIAARIELESMLQANRDRESQGNVPVYGEDALLALQEKYLITYNAVTTVFKDW